MRALEFRAWHIDANEYCEGSTSNMFQWIEDGQPVQLEQYTGLKDKNGVKIFENDIYNHGLFAFNDTNKYGPVCWDHLPTGVDGNDLSTIKCTLKASLCHNGVVTLHKLINSNPDVSGVEVIGNIHQNPELLEQKK